MLPPAYFEIICCPACRGALGHVTDARLCCEDCAAEYPIVEGIPVLLTGHQDDVSRTVSAFYTGEWASTYQAHASSPKPSDPPSLLPVAHDDASKYGLRYVRKTERRFLSEFEGRRPTRRFFLDAACGAFPRRTFGRGYTYHVCLDFAFGGLLAARQLLGERGLYVCGSLLEAPVRDAVADAILASHCIYHIDRDLQGRAVRELLRALAPGGKLVMFYANPENVSSRLLGTMPAWPLKAILDRARRRARPLPAVATDHGPTVYCYLHPIACMMNELTSVHQDAQVSVKTLCLLPFAERAPLFQTGGGLAALAYALCMALEKVYARRPDMAYYLTYVAEREQRDAVRG